MTEFQPITKDITIGKRVRAGDSLEYPAGTGKVVGIKSVYSEIIEGGAYVYHCEICRSMSFDNCEVCPEKKICPAAMAKVTDL